MKLLLMCYECSPYVGSEWAVGWGRLLGAARIAVTHVVTSEANYADLVRARAEGLLPRNVHFHTPPPDARLRALEKEPGVFAYNYKAYRHWQILALRLVQDLHAQERFDLVHQVNVCTFREPGFTFNLGIPFIWGPVGGTQNFPIRFLTALPPGEAVKEGLRGVANRMTLRRPYVRTAAAKSARLLAANSNNQRDLQRVLGARVERLLETGIHHVSEPDRARYTTRISDKLAGRPARTLKLLWSGELHTRKALPVLLRALRHLQGEVPFHLDVLGKGPMQTAWVRETERLGLAAQVTFLGHRPFREAVAAMHTADVLCFTSLRDTSGNVVLEALAAGVPVICFDHHGAGDIVTASCGIKLAVKSPRRAYRDLADALRSLAFDPDRLFVLSHGATDRARDFLWSTNHKRVNTLYREVTGAAGERRGSVAPSMSPAVAIEGRGVTA